MGHRPTGNPMGRPKKVIDQKQFEAMCSIQCTLEEICAVFDVTDNTLNSWCKETYGTTFSEVFKQKRGIGKASLRRRQWELAKNSVPMAIFLGKNWLGQTDKQETTVLEVEDLSTLAEMLKGDDNPGDDKKEV